MKPSKDDLYRRCPRHNVLGPHRDYEHGSPEDSWCKTSQKATDADLAAMGYVKLEGIDVEYLRKSVDSREATFGPDVFVELARQVLAALDGEGEV